MMFSPRRRLRRAMPRRHIAATFDAVALMPSLIRRYMLTLLMPPHATPRCQSAPRHAGDVIMIAMLLLMLRCAARRMRASMAR